MSKKQKSQEKILGDPFLTLAGSAEIQRDNPLVEAIGKGIWGLTDEQINNVFKLTKTSAS